MTAQYLSGNRALLPLESAPGEWVAATAVAQGADGGRHEGMLARQSELGLARPLRKDPRAHRELAWAFQKGAFVALSRSSKSLFTRLRSSLISRAFDDAVSHRARNVFTESLRLAESSPKSSGERRNITSRDFTRLSAYSDT